VRAAALAIVVWMASVGSVHAAAVAERIGREENRTQKIGDQTQQVARELATIVRDLEINQLLTREENKDFETARAGMDGIARREIRAVLDRLFAARQALERAQQQDSLRQTVGAQEQLIARLTEELVRIQYRSQLRHLLEQMRTIVGDQRQAIGITQNGAIELAATNSDTLRGDILERVAQTQDTVWHDWVLVREQVNVMVQRYSDLPFIAALKQFQTKTTEMPVDQRLAETRDHLKGQRFGLAVAGQRQLSDYFLELLKVLQAAGLSPAEQRSALENLIEKTEEAIRQQQELRAQTETIGRDLTEPLRNEMARAEDQLSNFAKDLALEAEQVSRPEASPSERSEKQEARGENKTDRTNENPKSKIQNPKSQENPWAKEKNQPERNEPRAPSSPASGDLSKASDDMSNAASQLTQAKLREASEAQQAAINDLAGALAHLRQQLDANAQASQADALAEMLDRQGELLDRLGQIIRNQEGLKGLTEKAAQSPAPANPPSAASEKTDTGKSGAKPEGRQQAEIPTPAELSQAQSTLRSETQEFANQAGGATPAAEPLDKAVAEMGRAASELSQSQAGEAVPHQNQALRSLRDAERQLAEAMAQALDAQQLMEMLQEMGDLDQMIGQIEQMAGQAETMVPAPAPEMAQQANNIADQLDEMAGAPPMTPAMAAQVRGGSKMMGSAGQQLEQGQTPQAAQTMHEAAKQLGSVRGEMAAQASSELAQAQAAAQALQAAQQGQKAQNMAATKAMQPATQPSRSTGKGEGMRGAGPTTYDPKKELERELESGVWSRLPAREREQVLQALKEKYPARYERELIRYYRNLSRVESEK
jgi:hypothetical protein